MTTQATLTSSFTRAAIKFQVAESDYLVLCSQKVDTFEAMAYRMPKSDDLEDFLHAYVVPSSGYREEDGTITILRCSGENTEPARTQDLSQEAMELLKRGLQG